MNPKRQDMMLNISDFMIIELNTVKGVENVLRLVNASLRMMT